MSETSRLHRFVAAHPLVSNEDDSREMPHPYCHIQIMYTCSLGHAVFPLLLSPEVGLRCRPISPPCSCLPPCVKFSPLKCTRCVLLSNFTINDSRAGAGANILGDFKHVGTIMAHNQGATCRASLQQLRVWLLCGSWRLQSILLDSTGRVESKSVVA